MAGKNTDFVPLIRPKDERPPSQEANSKKNGFLIFSSADLVILRDQLSISTWLALGAVFQALLYLIVGRLAFVPAVALLFYRLGDAFLISTGTTKNPYMEGVIKNKFSAQYPNVQGHFGASPADEDICVFLIGTRSNHPMGIFGKGAQEISDFFGAMTGYLDQHADEFGYLGGSSWLSVERAGGNEVMSVMYFRGHEGVHRFAHHELHRKAWNWWNKNVADMPYIGIWHELYVASKGNWENIYINSAPLLMSATSFRIEPSEKKGTTDSEARKPLYVSPIVDARRGLLKTSAGRMSKSQATEHDKYNDDPYANYGKLGYLD